MTFLTFFPNRSESETEVTPPPPPPTSQRVGGRIGSERVLKEEFRGGPGNRSDEDDDDASFVEGWASDLVRRGARVVQVGVGP